jgi:hypothetical protein
LNAQVESDRKSNQVDAEKLARYARFDPEIQSPIAHRTVEQQEALTLIRANRNSAESNVRRNQRQQQNKNAMKEN